VVAGSRLLLSEPLPGTVREIEGTARDHGLEGVDAKRRGSMYRPGLSDEGPEEAAVSSPHAAVGRCYF
jgi:ATP-dependent DNA ligase